MRHAEQQRLLRELRDGLANNTTVLADGILKVPVTDFTCRERLAREQQVFFRDTPLLLGASTDLPEPNTYLATSEVGLPILMTRDAQGEFRAFINVCRHRGMQVVPDGRGHKGRFACPFHAWTYQNSGELIAINREERFGCVDKTEHGLVALPAKEQFGMLWVKPSVGGDFDVADLLGGLADEMVSWDLPSHAFTEQQVLKANINWKLAIDTFGENYHFDVLHRDSLANDIHGNLQTSDVFGHNYRMVFASKGGFAHVHDNAVPIEQWPYRRITLNVYFIYPNVILLVDPAGVDILRMYPDDNDPSRSRTHHTFYQHPDYPALVEAQGGQPGESRFPGFNAIVAEEDYRAAESTQIGAYAGAQGHYLFGRNEPALHHYHNVHRAGLGEPLLTVETSAPPAGRRRASA